MSIRVIAGKAKGRKLKLVPGDTTRPVMDRVKENVFNIVNPYVVGSRWLDLFAGTGSIGIEALSRGAEYCLFFDTDKEAIRTIQDNLKLTRLGEVAKVERADALIALNNEPKESFEYIYIAPPQYKGIWKQALQALEARPDWLYPDGIAIVQIDPKEYEELNLTNFQLIDQRTYGNTMICFYERPGE
jgi:16S rRNA (guanine966-N2)-methyltransferase